MSIKWSDFEKGNFKKRHVDRGSHPVTNLLRKNSQRYALTVKEIVKETKMKEDTVRSMLHSLNKAGLIVHKTPYFGWKGAKKVSRPKKKSKARKRKR